MPTLTATPQPGNRPPLVSLDLNMSDLATVPTEATITRLDPDGRTRAVRLADPVQLVGGTATVLDYESPFGRPTTYRARAGGTTVESAAVTLDPARPWLRHPNVPSLSFELLALDASTDAERTRRSTRAVHQVLGRTTPLVITAGSRRSPESTLVVRTTTDTERRRLTSLLDNEDVLLLTVPVSRGWGALEHEYLSVGDVAEARLVNVGHVPDRRFTLPYVVVDRPSGGVVAAYTYADVLAEHPTYGDLLTRYATYGDLIANRRSDVTASE